MKPSPMLLRRAAAFILALSFAAAALAALPAGVTQGPTIDKVRLAAANVTGAKDHYYSTNHRAAALGYAPRFTSLAGIADELGRLMHPSRVSSS